MNRRILGFLATAAVIIAVALIRGFNTTEPGRTVADTTLVGIRYLWDGRDQSLEEWKFLKAARDMTLSGDGTLYIADSGNSRLIQFRLSDSSGSVAGRFGSGPGEFHLPSMVLLGDDEEELWVYDGRLNRLVHFDIGDRLEYSASYGVPFLPVSRHVSLGVIPGDSYFMLPAATEDRIVRIGLDGTPISGFGDPLDKESEIGTYANRGWLYLAGPMDEVLFIGEFVPIIEKYSVDGQLVQSRRFFPPEAENRFNQSIQDLGMSPSDAIILVYDTYLSSHSNRLFILYSQTRKSTLVIYEVSTDSLEIIARYETGITYKERLEDNLILNPIAINDLTPEISLLGVDVVSGSLVQVECTPSEIPESPEE